MRKRLHDRCLIGFWIPLRMFLKKIRKSSFRFFSKQTSQYYLLGNKLETREEYNVHICNIIGLVEIDEFMKWKIQCKFYHDMPVMKALSSSVCINWSFLKTWVMRVLALVHQWCSDRGAPFSSCLLDNGITIEVCKI